MYYYEVELVFKSYMPKKLEKGMLFVSNTPEGVVLFELNDIPFNTEKFITKNGAPVELWILDEETVIANPEEIALLEIEEDKYRNLSLADINFILLENQGWLEIGIYEEFFDDLELIIPIIHEKKVITRFLTEEQDEK